MTANAIRRAVFLDRDGCISPDEFGYISDPSSYHLYSYTGEALRMLKELGFLLFVVTNQSGIARGYFGVEELDRVLDRMRGLVSQEGVELDGVYYSPYFKDGIVTPWNVEHEDRKPGLGMFRTALREHRFQASASWMIGDRYTDVEFGKKAGLRTILLLSGNGWDELRTNILSWEYQPDLICEDLLIAARVIQKLAK
ncbi:MAG TPA: HAD family hydrolase [Candidatus Cloacimonadota bacterium]|nr:HAD family hydrolase [Candidatus Cloacimonadota bacterium]